MVDSLCEKQKKYNDQFKKVVSERYSLISLSKPKIKTSLPLPIVDIEAHIRGFIEYNNWPPFTICAQQCVKWSYALEQVVSTAYGMKAWVTLGQIVADKIKFCPSQETIDQWVSEGIHPHNMNDTGFNLHAWITLENGTIIDLTFLSSIAQVFENKWSHVNGKIQVGFKSDIFRELTYTPMLAGHKHVLNLHKKSSIPLLAKNKDELHPIVLFALQPIHR